MKRGAFLLFCLAMFVFKLHAQTTYNYTPGQLAQIKKLKAKVESSPENLEVHHAFIYSFTLNDPAVATQYQSWIKQFPKSFSIPFAIAREYVQQRNPKAAPFMVQASKIKPDNAEIWNLFSQFALFTNNVALQQKYLQKAIKLDPANAEYAFYYAYSFKDINTERYDSLSLEVFRRFPKNEHGTMALFWLADNSTVQEQKIAYFNELSNSKENSNYYLTGMTIYADLLLNTKPEQAFELGLKMILEGGRNRNLWYERNRVATAFLQARQLLTQSQPVQALKILNAVDLGKIQHGNFIDARETLALFKAEAADATRKTTIAYDSLANYYCRRPSDRLHKALFEYGNRLGLDSNSIMKNIYKIRESIAIPATDFCLDNYLKPGKYGLADYAGKVIVLTYWHPACFSCKEQFTHFEPVVRKFDSTKVAYLALNIDPVQDEFVVPFLQAGGYSFTPLHDDGIRQKGNLKALGATVNYIIDQKGRIVFSDLQRSKEDERTLEIMIQELLASNGS
jgi:peroxiredoxin